MKIEFNLFGVDVTLIDTEVEFETPETRADLDRYEELMTIQQPTDEQAEEYGRLLDRLQPPKGSE